MTPPFSFVVAVVVAMPFMFRLLPPFLDLLMGAKKGLEGRKWMAAARGDNGEGV